MNTTTTPRIAIVGAGPGGLLLSRLLHLASIPFTPYEREPHRHSREQGGSLDLHEESGQLALKEAQLIGEFRKIARAKGEDMRIADKTGHLHWEEVDTDGHGRPEVDRLLLRGWLLDSLPEDAVEWGCKVRSITPTEGGKHDIHIEAASGSEKETFDLTVGADDTWSKVRPLLSETKPQYSTISYLDTRIHSIDTRSPHISKFVEQGSSFAFSDYKGLMANAMAMAVYARMLCCRWERHGLRICMWTGPILRLRRNSCSRNMRIGMNASRISYAVQIPPALLYQLPTDFAWTSKQGLTSPRRRGSPYDAVCSRRRESSHARRARTFKGHHSRHQVRGSYQYCA
ncbi:hypothetical protein ABVK25_003042 [Lepraria finkii]|uniref:FAD-binding domain-containing protein n=1 Tax=Lepraria finkii TaxID=1340010 RepID=A0ABR4BL12_9LECA